VGRQGGETLAELGNIGLADSDVMDAAQHAEHPGSKLAKGDKRIGEGGGLGIKNSFAKGTRC
jgi:hypothetical protein